MGLGASFVCVSAAAALAIAIGCATGAEPSNPGATGTGGTSGATSTATGSGGELGFDGGIGGAAGCGCTRDFRGVIGCDGELLTSCAPEDTCDPSTGTCVNACVAAAKSKQSVGCEYYATFMDNMMPEVCFAVFVANTSPTAAHLTVERGGMTLPVGLFTRIPSGAGPFLQYAPYDEVAGLPPGEVAILFLSGPSGLVEIPKVACPVPSAIPTDVILNGTGIGESFHIVSDAPVVAYQIAPYGGANSAVTGASLLLPTSAWDDNYVAANAFAHAPSQTSPSMNIVAMENGTVVSMVPVAPVEGGNGIPSSEANVPLQITLNQGQHAQLSQFDELTGSIVKANKPIGFMAGHRCMSVPVDAFACDHGEQMVPPIRALGHEYVGVMHRPRKTEPAVWRLVGAVDGTTLEWSSDVGGPSSLQRGEVAQLITDQPFVVKSQDADHPFMLFSHMTGSTYLPELTGYGDPDTVISVPVGQYMRRYVFFADPTYPETNLVLVRAKVDGQFADVTLDCAGVLDGWKPIGDYEWTRVDLITKKFQNVGNCSTGRHEIESDAPFGLWIWGWGTPEAPATGWVSYGYPGGMNVQPINRVVVPPVPK